MRNDSRPIGEKLREIEDHDRHERMVGQERREELPKSSGDKSFIVGHDTGDEDAPRKPQEQPRRS
jgi:hypothetical protein